MRSTILLARLPLTDGTWPARLPVLSDSTSRRLVFLGLLLLAGRSAWADSWVVEPAVDVARSARAFRGMAMAESNGAVAVAWASGEGVFVRVGPTLPAAARSQATRLGSGQGAGLLARPGGLLARWVSLEGRKWSEKAQMVAWLDRRGQLIGAPQDTGGREWPSSHFARTATDLYALSTYTYAEPTLARVPLASGGKARQLGYRSPCVAEDFHASRAEGMAMASGWLEILWSCGPDENSPGQVSRLRWQRMSVDGKGAASALRLPGAVYGALFSGGGWLVVQEAPGTPGSNDPRSRPGAVFRIERDQRGQARLRRIGQGLKLHPGRMLEHGAGFVWLQVRPAGRAGEPQALELLRIDSDGKLQDSLVVEPRLGPEYRRHPPQFEAGDTAYQGIALAQVGEDILVAWQVRQGKEIVLRVTRVRPQAN